MTTEPGSDEQLGQEAIAKQQDEVERDEQQDEREEERTAEQPIEGDLDFDDPDPPEPDETHDEYDPLPE